MLNAARSAGGHDKSLKKLSFVQPLNPHLNISFSNGAAVRHPTASCVGSGVHARPPLRSLRSLNRLTDNTPIAYKIIKPLCRIGRTR